MYKVISSNLLKLNEALGVASEMYLTVPKIRLLASTPVNRSCLQILFNVQRIQRQSEDELQCSLND